MTTFDNLALSDAAQPQRSRIGQLTLSQEGLSLASHPPLIPHWNEISKITLQGTRTQAGFFWHTSYHGIAVTVNGFVEIPIILSARGLTASRTIKKLYEELTDAWRARRGGMSEPPQGRILRVTADAASGRICRLNLSGLERVPGEILLMIRHLLKTQRIP